MTQWNKLVSALEARRDVRELKKLYERAAISRRTFMRRLAGLGVGSALAGHVLASARASDAATARRGGTLKLGMAGGSTTDTMDPALAPDDVPYVCNFMVYNNLTELTADKQPIPELAESWEAKPGAAEWVFNLRRGVEFHNGKSLDAEDVVYSLRRHIGPDSKSVAKGLLSGVTTIEALGKHQVRIRLESGNADLAHTLGEFHFGIVPKGHNEWDVGAVGTGPYPLRAFEPGVRILGERNPNYWKPDRAWVDTVEVTVINDATARMSAFRTGAVHAVNRVDRKVARLVEEGQETRIVRSPGATFQEAVMRTDTDPFTDNHVRLALKHATDREAMLENSLRGYGSLGNDHPIPPNDPFYHSELPQRTYDPDKSRFLLRKAGLDSLRIDLSTSPGAFPEAVDYAVLLQQSAQAAGVEINIVREPADGYWSNVWMQRPFCMSYWGTRPTPDIMFSIAYKSDANWNEAYWRREDFDALLLEARATIDFERRKALYWAMQEMVHEDGGNLIATFGDNLDGYRREVSGTEPDGVREMMGSRVAERVWFEG